MIDRQNTINYLMYLLKMQKIQLKKTDLKKLERITITNKINLLENIISSIRQMPEAILNNNNNILKEEIIKNKIRKNSNTKFVEQYDMNNNFIREYCSPTDAHNETGIKLSGIINTIAKRQTNAGGFIWKYKNEEVGG